jgi:hypothetical protein
MPGAKGKGNPKSKRGGRSNKSGNGMGPRMIRTRLANPNEPCEMYAKVIKMFGQGICEVLCNDNKM